MKTKLLRDIKTESLLIYVQSILEKVIIQIRNNQYKIDLEDSKLNNEIQENIFFLYDNLKKNVLSPKELNEKVLSSNQEITKYNAIFFYYNELLKQLQFSLKKEDFLIPEQVIFSLLCEWIIEEGKPTVDFTFLEKINYLKLLSFYENPKAEEKYKKNLLKMYKISSSMIEKLKKAKYKINTKPMKSRKYK